MRQVTYALHVDESIELLEVTGNISTNTVEHETEVVPAGGRC